jgi:signal transduction histidine kinase
VIVPLAIAMLLLVGAFIAAFFLEARHREADDIERTATSVDAMFRAQSAEGTQVMRSIMELLLKDSSLEAALRARDRQKLLDLSTPILNEIRAKNHITHFYYILPDRTMLLRVQAPHKHGDKIERFVLREAQRTGQPFWGNEQGPLGSFTLRVVYPWVSNGEVIGYLEMGIEFEDIMQSIKSSLDVDVFVAINKSFFDRAKWDEAQAKNKRPVAWDEFPWVVVLSRTTPAIPAPIAAYLEELKEEHSKRSFEIAWDGQVEQTVVTPFANLRGEQLGELVVVRDITAGAKERRRAVIVVALLSAVIGGALLLLFHVLLGRVQRDVAERTARLSEAQRVLTVEQLERKRAEGELAAQQERNELLEARSRMVSELAAAKEAAEAALQENEKVTAQLRLVQGELLAEIAERKQLQSQLVQSDKLASIGQLAAGVAHEINNPIGYIFSNFSTLEGYLDKLFDMLASYESAEPSVSAPDVAARLREQRERVELGFLKDDIPVLLRESKQGIARVRQIVQDLKDFSRVDSAQDFEWANLHRGIDSTLNVVASEIKYKADVVKEYGTLPDIECLPSQINQVVMNLLVNAAQSIGEQRGLITIRTGADAEWVWLEVADTGSGIAPDTLERIFDPFFTTKPVGKGTGLGLSLSYGIVQKHHGRIDVDSVVGRGTTFRVTLPIHSPARCRDQASV